MRMCKSQGFCLPLESAQVPSLKSEAICISVGKYLVTVIPSYLFQIYLYPIFKKSTEYPHWLILYDTTLSFSQWRFWPLWCLEANVEILPFFWRFHTPFTPAALLPSHSDIQRAKGPMWTVGDPKSTEMSTNMEALTALENGKLDILALFHNLSIPAEEV